MFVNTEKGSIISTFRLSSEKAAKELWEMYSDGTFQSMLQTVLVENALKDDDKQPGKPLEFKVTLGEERFEKIRKKLEGILESVRLNRIGKILNDDSITTKILVF